MQYQSTALWGSNVNVRRNVVGVCHHTASCWWKLSYPRAPAVISSSRNQCSRQKTTAVCVCFRPISPAISLCVVHIHNKGSCTRDIYQLLEVYLAVVRTLMGVTQIRNVIVGKDPFEVELDEGAFYWGDHLTNPIIHKVKARTQSSYFTLKYSWSHKFLTPAVTCNSLYTTWCSYCFSSIYG